MCLFINLHSVLPINSKEDTRVAFDGDSWESADCARLPKVKSLRWHDEWCVNTKWSAGPNYLHNLKNCRVNPRLQSKPVSLFSLKILTKFRKRQKSMIYMTKMQIRVGKIFRNYLINNSLHEKGSNPKNSFQYMIWSDLLSLS